MWMNKKPIITEIDNVRIRRWDDSNVFIEREETYWNPKDKTDITGYRFKGYYSTVLSALESIHIKGLLIEENSVRELNDILKQVRISERKVIEAINRLDVNAK